MSLLQLLFIYVLGGLTFVPLVIASFITILLYNSPPVDHDKKKPLEEVSEKAELSAADKDLKGTSNKYGWITIRRTFEPPAPTSDSTYSSLLLNSYRNLRASKDAKKPKDFFYTILKGEVLYLYEDEQLTEVYAVLDLSFHTVRLYPEGTPDPELFAKRNSICLRPKPASEIRSSSSGLPSVTKDMKTPGPTFSQESPEADEGVEVDDPLGNKLAPMKTNLKRRDSSPQSSKSGVPTPESQPWFMFFRRNTEMEDWYLALYEASKEVLASGLAPSDLSPVFSEADMAHLVDTLDFEPDPIPMRWLNGLFGRLFLGINKTAWLEEFIVIRMMKKLSRVKTPGFLSAINVSSVSLSSPAPFFSKPMLKELTPQGDASIEIGLTYRGEVRIVIETIATINLGSRFKPYNVPLVLAVIVKDIEGNLLVKIKRPPSSRLWYGFTKEPKMTINVEPVVSERQIKWSMILKPIERQLRDIISDSVILPNMDDVPFFNTMPFQRGGLFGDARKIDKAAPTGIPATPGEDFIDIAGHESSAINGVQSSKVAHVSGSEENLTSTMTDDLTGSTVPRSETTPDLLNPTATTVPVKKRWFGTTSDISLSNSPAPCSSPPDPLVLSASAASTSSLVSEPWRSGHIASKSVDSPGTSPASSVSDARPASIVSSIRQKTQDKQALSTSVNHAKDSMKKWGANWAQKRKAQREQRMQLNEDDIDESWHQRVLEEENSDEPQHPALGHTSSQIFGRLSSQLASATKSTTAPPAEELSSNPSATSLPILVPQSGRNRQNSASSFFNGGVVSPGNDRTVSPKPSSVTPSSSAQGSKFVLPSAPKTTIGITGVLPSSPPMPSEAGLGATNLSPRRQSASFVDPLVTASTPSTVNIGVQPKKITGMSIPGIPKERQADIMHYSSQPSPTVEVSSSDPSSKRLYKLFGAGSPSSTLVKSATSPSLDSDPFFSNGSTTVEGVSNPTLSQDISPSDIAVPVPRSTSIDSSTPSFLTSSPEASTLPLPPLPLHVPSTPLPGTKSSASDSLASIVAMDKAATGSQQQQRLQHQQQLPATAHGQNTPNVQADVKVEQLNHEEELSEALADLNREGHEKEYVGGAMEMSIEPDASAVLTATSSTPPLLPARRSPSPALPPPLPPRTLPLGVADQ